MTLPKYPRPRTLMIVRSSIETEGMGIEMARIASIHRRPSRGRTVPKPMTYLSSSSMWKRLVNFPSMMIFVFGLRAISWASMVQSSDVYNSSTGPESRQ